MLKSTRPATVFGILAAAICSGTLAANSPAQPTKSTDSRPTVRVAGIVLKWLPTDKAANYRRAEPLIRKAACQGADIVCTTEGFLKGYAIDDKSIPLEKFRALGEQIPGGKYFEQLRELAKELRIQLVAGMLERDGEHLYNTAVIISPDGELIGKYHQQSLGHEAVRITAGEESSVHKTRYGRIGVMICADRREQEVVGRFREQGADFLICPSGGMLGPVRNDPILQARSRETGKHIVFVHPAEFLVTGPGGDILARTILGDRRSIEPGEVGKARDSSGVFHFDLPLPEGVKDPSKNRQRPDLAPYCRLADLLAEPLIDPALPWQEIRAYVEARIPVPQPPTALAAWEAEAAQIRREMLDNIVFRGEAVRWRDAPSRVEWFDSIETGSGYRIKKFRYEALPGFWAPALLYEPSDISEKMPVFINVNGHHRGGKAMPYKQRRCINLAKRGILAFNLEFIDMGQLHEPQNLNKHNRLVQIDLCGTSGLAPFWLVMTRGLDVALSHEFADPSRVGVAGLSGGGWQTIWLASLDTRITLANPVAGYGSTFVRSARRNNIGDAEQIPSDMCKVGDYTHLTALVAPRPLLLTNNAKDDCCFLPQDVFPRLKDAAIPIYRVYDRLENFSTHINYEPGTHNFDSDNREALYRQLKAHFFADDPSFDPADIPISEDELKSEAELAVPMPHGNATLHSLAVGLSRSLPEGAALPSEKDEALAWQSSARTRLRALVQYEDYDATRQVIKQDQIEGAAVDQVHFRLDDTWTLPAVVLTPARFESTVVLISDEGRASLAKQAQRQAAAGRRVVAADLTGFGEANGDLKQVEPLLIATVGRRPLGVYAAQLAALARWARGDQGNHPVTVTATGPRNGTIALVAAALETDAISALDLHDTWGSLTQLIEKNLTAEDAPEQFCFGLLKELDIPQLIALVAPRSVVVHEPDAELRSQRSTLRSWYATLGANLDPLTNESSSRTVQD